MHAELLTIGSELVNGATINTNAAYLARRLAELGIACRRQVAVGDAREALTEALREALERCELLIVTGGLGPTFDDITMDVIADVTHHPLTHVPAIAATIRRFYTRRHRALQRAALRQAEVPTGGLALPNPLGTAPGLWLDLAPPMLIALPGVPSEMRAIFERSVIPLLKRRAGAGVIDTRTLRTVGLVELSIQSALHTIRIPADVEIGLYPNLRMVDVRLTATASSRAQAGRLLSPLERRLRRALGRAVYGVGDETLEGVVGALLIRRRATVSVAESCTGGLLTDRLTNVPGSSRYVRGGVIAYHNDIKAGLLDVPTALVRRDGAVSASVAKAMAQGARRVAGSDVGIAITGIAGPSGATASKPVGLVYLGLSDRNTTRAQRCQFFGDRLSIKAQAAQAALDWLRCHLLASR